ncbi:LuxR C-terminal-related transcriptional regulator [Pseudomonas sp. H9]|uniref:LuxR C-terminal-related transcriptional regulator n=1 Tax=Pseudomonas sp. H9 TaxID=483968 RepID=UPI0010583ACD|nr:LuxR C-terminal-related transcriptional regulator [Pseudomonas sp. H9]TDF80756.1 LuxR family transcriptional regulator [Pseudomonas sp. H9]
MSDFTQSGPRTHSFPEHLGQSIPDTKVVPPRGARRMVPRETLLARLLEARRQRCVVIQGPAGSGKTSTLLAWRRELLPLNFEVAWLSLMAEDNELTRFADCLLTSLAQVSPDVVRDASILLGRDSDELAVENWAITLSQGLAARQPTRDLVLMVDDLHHLEDARVLLLLQYLLEYAPTNFHLVLGTRHQVALPQLLARLRAQGALSEFDLRDLRFSLAESERFLREQFADIDVREVERLHALTDGWVAGLQLFALDLKGKQGTQFLPVQMRDASAFAEYFEREVLVRLANEDLAALSVASICNRFCASLCATLLGAPHSLPKIMNRLARLDNGDLFITQVKSLDRETWYRLHPLLREVLRARIPQQGPELQALHAIARDWFYSRGHVDEAVRHAVQAGDSQAAADIIEACASELLSRGNLAQLSGLLRRMPAEMLNQRLGLRLLMAHLQLYARNFVELRKNLEYLEAQRLRLSSSQCHALTLLYAEQALHLDDYLAMERLAPELQAIPMDIDDFIHTGRSINLAWLAMYQGHFEQARAMLEESDRPAGSPRRSLMARCLGGMSIALQGRLSQAEHIFRDALDESQAQGVGYVIVAGMAAGLLAISLYEQNQCEAALQVVEPRLSLLERISIPDTVLQVLCVRAEVLWQLGRREESDSCLDRLATYAQRDGMKRLLAYALFLELRHQLLRGDTERAQATFVRLQPLAGTDGFRLQGIAQEIYMIVERARLMLALSQGDWDSVLTRAEPLIRQSQARGRYRRVVVLTLQLALGERGAGNLQAATQRTLDALRLGHRLGLHRSVLDVAPDVVALIEQIRADKMLDPVLDRYAQRLLGLIDEPEEQDAPAPDNAPLGGLRQREIEVLELVAQALPNKKIARVLNVSPETVKWHLKNIFLKLGVNSRDEAIACLRDLKAARSGRQ